MKFIIPADDFKRALGTCNEIAPTSSTVAEEKTGVLISAKDGMATFVSSDETSYVKVSVPAQVMEGGEALVRCQSVSSNASASYKLEDAPLRVETAEKRTLKISGAGHYSSRTDKPMNCTRSFPLLNPGFFVEPPPFDDTQVTKFKALDFQDGLLAVAHAASKDTSKLHFNCINVTFTDETVVFAATDGIQIAEFKKAAQVMGLRGSFILGLKFASVLSKHVADTLRAGEGEDTVEIYVKGENFFMRSGETTLVGSLLTVDFPDYAAHLSTAGKQVAIFPREDFLSILQGIQPSVDIKSHRMVIDAKPSGSATLSTSSINTSAAESSDLEVQTPEGFVLHIDSVFLQNAVQQLKDDLFEFHFTQDAAGVVIKSPEQDVFRALVCTLKRVV
jgi:DNA polymerase III sliding clamp (beta) subunit (PCNA family)